ncbi:hypothetical protein MMC22_005746 [Lobaria immixta]|nr:hypothetical protein [Lobaria immixta]
MGITLIIGVHGKAIAYPAPYNGDLTPEEKMTYLDPIIELSGKIQSAFVVLMVLAFGIIKLSITLYYRRIFVGIKGTLFDWITKVAIVIVVLWTIACLVSSIFSCGAHFSANWGTFQDVVKYCGAMTNITNAFVVSDLITDIMILCLPLPVIWKIQMTTTRKLIVTGILATGAVSIVASIIKVIISFEIINGGPNINVDPELTASTILYWSMIEGGLAVVAACLPTLRVLVSKMSLSSIIRSVRSALSLGSTYTQKQSKQFPPRFGESYATVQSASPSSSTSLAPTVVGEKRGSIDSLITGNVDGMEAKRHSIQVTRQFSQHASMV